MDMVPRRGTGALEVRFGTWVPNLKGLNRHLGLRIAQRAFERERTCCLPDQRGEAPGRGLGSADKPRSRLPSAVLIYNFIPSAHHRLVPT